MDRPQIVLKTPVPLHKMNDKEKRNDNMRYNIIPMTKGMTEITPELDGKNLYYGRSGSFSTDDSGVANAIKDKYGHMVDVWETKGAYHPSDQGHRYTFGNVDLPWKKDNPNYDEYGKRIDNNDVIKKEDKGDAVQEQKTTSLDAY